MKTRVRFAPSPTGRLHIGNARTALFNYLFARKTCGTFILRIEDTDRERSKKEFEEGIINDLSWLSLSWDEGPDHGGKFAPYRQSERQEIYDHMISQLLSEGNAYRCYCTEEELEERRLRQVSNGEPPRYDGRCRELPNSVARSYEDEKRPFTIRFLVSKRAVEVDDLVKGKVAFDASRIGDFVIRRSDGSAAFNFANMIDDSLMRITHVIRGDDHLSNTPRQILLSETLGLSPPQFAHLPLIFGTDRTPLSKRHGDVSINSFREAGYLPAALLNYLGHLGHSYGEGKDILSMDDLAAGFDLNRVAGSPAVFDTERLNWINSHYIRSCDARELSRLTIPYLERAGIKLSGKDDGWFSDALDAVRGEASTLMELASLMSIFSEYTASANEEAMMILKEPASQAVIKVFGEEFQKETVISPDAYRSVSERVKTRCNVKGKALFMPLRAALTGKTKGAEMDRITTLLGRNEILSRLQKYI